MKKSFHFYNPGMKTHSPVPFFLFFLFFLFLLLVLCSSQSMEFHALMAIRRILKNPPSLTHWNYTTDFCNDTDYSTASSSVLCYDYSVTQLHIFGEYDNGSSSPPLPADFSMDELFTELAKFSVLKVLSLVSLGIWGPIPPCIIGLSSLEILNMSSNFINGAIPLQISNLTNIQTLNFDHNMLSGSFPSFLTRLPQLSVLSLRNNYISGPLPDSISRLESLRILCVSFNNLSGEVPDLRRLSNLQVLDMEKNNLGGSFPLLNHRLLVLLLGKNMFRSGIPPNLSSFFQLQKMDISSNNFVGQFPPLLLSLNSLTYLDVSKNQLTGLLNTTMECNHDLVFVNLSYNMLRGELPKCLLQRGSSSVKRVVDFNGNCLDYRGQKQRGVSSCQNQALAAEIPRRMEKKKRRERLGSIAVAFCVVGGAGVVFMLFLLLVLLAFTRLRKRRKEKEPEKIRVINEKIRAVKFSYDTGHMCHKIKLGPLGLPSYRTFPLHELKAATNNFDPSLLLVSHHHHPVYRGELADGTHVAIRSAKADKHQSLQAYTGWVEMVSRLRHPHLTSVLGHCFEYDNNNNSSSVRIVHLIFENPVHMSLRNHISGIPLELQLYPRFILKLRLYPLFTAEGRPGQNLSWSQRMTAAIGVIKGVQFLHSGVIPGVFTTGINISDVHLDPNLQVKICCYNSPLLEVLPGPREGYSPEREERRFENDVRDVGVILLEIVTGVTMLSDRDICTAKKRLPKGGMMGDVADTCIVGDVSDESLRAVIDICGACLADNPVDRPSADDVLWHVQFAAQVHDTGGSSNAGGSCRSLSM